MIRKSSILLLLSVSCLGGCGRADGPASTETVSTEFPTLQAKIRFLEQYVKFRRSYDALEFVISYQNNSASRTSIPGPSDWDIRIAAQVPPTELDQWTDGLKPTSAPDVKWLDDLPGEIDRSGVSAWFAAPGRLVGVDKTNGIVVYGNSTVR